MYTVGITGGIGSGKSEASKIFTELAVPVIDLDDIAHQITKKNQPGYIEIKKYFGEKYFDKNKELIRKNLQIDIFNSTQTKKKIESILHPIIFNECKKQINRYKSAEYIVIVIQELVVLAQVELLHREKGHVMAAPIQGMPCDDFLRTPAVRKREPADPSFSIIVSHVPDIVERGTAPIA